MTAADLIAELQKHPPGRPVRVVLSSIYWADEAGETLLTLCTEDSLEARDVRNEGAFVLIVGGKD